MEPDSQIYFCAESELEFLKKKDKNQEAIQRKLQEWVPIHPSLNPKPSISKIQLEQVFQATLV